MSAEAAEPRTSRREWLSVLGLSAGLLAFYVTYSISRVTTYLASGYDLGIFDQAVRAYARFQAPVAPLKGRGYNVLGDHFHPILVVVAPLYWIWDSPIVLLVVQAVLLSATAPLVYRFTRRRAGHWLALVVAAAFGVGWAVQSMIDFDFHEIAFAVPLLALAIDALDRRADRALLVSAGLLLLVREDMGLLVIVLGIIRASTRVEGRRSWRSARPGLFMIAVGALGYVLVTEVAIAHFAPDRHFAYWQYTELGSNLPNALGNLISHPWKAVRLFFSPSDKTISLAYLLLPLLLLPLRSRYAWLALPLLAERYYNFRPELWTTHYHYSVLPWVVLVLAMVDGSGRLGLLRAAWPRRVLIGWLLVVPVWLTAYGHTAPSDVRRMITGAAWRTDAHTAAQKAVVARIPSDTCVAVDDRLAVHLDKRDYVTLADLSFDGSDFIALDSRFASVGGNNGPPPAQVLTASRADGYRVVFSQDSLTLLQSPRYAGPSRACRATGPGRAGP